MNIKLVISYALSLVAFVMMKMHLPGSALLVLISVIMQIVLTIIYAIRFKENRQMSAYLVSCSLLILYLFDRMMFWPNMFFLEMAIIGGGLHFCISFKKGVLYTPKNGILVVLLLCGLALSFVRTSTFYEFKYSDKLVAADEVCYDEDYSVADNCCHWAEYAYYFAIEGNKEEALKAVDVSIDIANRGKCNQKVLDALQQQRHLIETDHNSMEELLPTLVEEWDF